MRILGIETSCDESAVAVLDEQRGLLAHELWSQIDLHRAFGGVVPELASRDHLRRLLPLLRSALERAATRASEIEGVAYTAGPGLVGALLTGAALAHSAPVTFAAFTGNGRLLTVVGGLVVQSTSGTATPTEAAAGAFESESSHAPPSPGTAMTSGTTPTNSISPAKASTATAR